MNVNYIHIKKVLIGLMVLFAGYVLYLLIFSFISRPDSMNINFSPIQGSAQFSSSIETNEIESSSSSTFDYKVIGLSLIHI